LLLPILCRAGVPAASVGGTLLSRHGPGGAGPSRTPCHLSSVIYHLVAAASGGPEPALNEVKGAVAPADPPAGRAFPPLRWARHSLGSEALGEGGLSRRGPGGAGPPDSLPSILYHLSSRRRRLRWRGACPDPDALGEGLATCAGRGARRAPIQLIGQDPATQGEVTSCSPAFRWDMWHSRLGCEHGTAAPGCVAARLCGA